MKKVIAIIVFGLLWCNVAQAKNITFVCKWENVGKVIYEASYYGKIFLDGELDDQVTFISVKADIVEYKSKYIKTDMYTNTKTTWNVHFKVNLNTGTAFEIQKSGNKTKTYHAKCEKV